MQSPSWEANWFAASQEIPRISRNPKIHYRTHKGHRLSSGNKDEDSRLIRNVGTPSEGSSAYRRYSEDVKYDPVTPLARDNVRTIGRIYKEIYIFRGKMNQIQRRRLKFSVFLRFWDWIKPAWRTETLDYRGLEIVEQVGNIWYVIISFEPEIVIIGLIFKIPFLTDRKLTVLLSQRTNR